MNSHQGWEGGLISALAIQQEEWIHNNMEFT